MKAAVIGGAGYVAGELLRLLLQHPEIDECVVTSRSQAGRPISEVHPGVAPLTSACFAGSDPSEAAKGCDVVFLALEHGESSKQVAEILGARPGLVVDLSADFRIQDQNLYRAYYGDHAAPDLVPRFRYGLADILGAQLRRAPALAIPGCFATAAQIALFPLARAGLKITPSIFGVTGSSGAGAQLKSTTHHPTRAHNLFGYSAMGHRHEAEILESWRHWTGDSRARVRLLAHAGPFVRGIYLTLHAFLDGASVDQASAVQWYRDSYRGRPFVRILDSPPELSNVVGTNYALVHAITSPDGREIQVSVAIDNLVKGAGGQAVQAMNLALGMDECAGLRSAAPFPL